MLSPGPRSSAAFPLADFHWFLSVHLKFPNSIIPAHMNAYQVKLTCPLFHRTDLVLSFAQVGMITWYNLKKVQLVQWMDFIA